MEGMGKRGVKLKKQKNLKVKS